MNEEETCDGCGEADDGEMSSAHSANGMESGVYHATCIPSWMDWD